MMKKKALGFFNLCLMASFLVTCASTPKNLSKGISKDREVILSYQSGLEFFLRQTNVLFWDLKKKDIKNLSQKTQAYLHQLMASGKSFSKERQEKLKQVLEYFPYLRVQYVGLIKGDKKMILCNYFYDPSIEDDDYDWKLIPVMPKKQQKTFQHWYDSSSETHEDFHFYGVW